VQQKARTLELTEPQSTSRAPRLARGSRGRGARRLSALARMPK
jgi:hypothetical protein